MGVAYNPGVVTAGLGFAIDFANPKSVSGNVLTDMSKNRLAITVTNPTANTLTVANGYAEFNPANISASATYYTISNTYFNDIKSEITLETAVYAYGDFGSSLSCRPVSPRTTEVGSPLGYGITATTLTTEINTSNGWFTSNAGVTPIGFNQWLLITQTTSAATGKMRTYVNGKIVREQTFTGTPTGGNGILIGRGFYGGTANYYGRVGYVRVYNRALTDDEIYKNFNASRGRYGI